MMGLLRLFKVSGFLHEFFEAVQSEYMRIFLGIGKLLIMIMVINHFLACGFYWIGANWDLEDVSASSGWVYHHRLNEESLAYKYMTSLHWSLTQFTSIEAG